MRSEERSAAWRGGGGAVGEEKRRCQARPGPRVPRRREGVWRTTAASDDACCCATVSAAPAAAAAVPTAQAAAAKAAALSTDCSVLRRLIMLAHTVQFFECLRYGRVHGGATRRVS